MEEKLYFVIHAARQMGKATAMRAFAAQLRERGIVALHATLEASQGVTETADAEPLWLSAIETAAKEQLAPGWLPPDRRSFLAEAAGDRLTLWLRTGCEAQAPRPVDEADVVSGPALISLLRQLCGGFISRPQHRPASVALVGMRDLRDHSTHAKDGSPVNPGSRFNIKAASLTMRNFTEEEVGELCAQHTAATGQRLLPEAVARSFWWSQGQPFLVNAMARIAVMELWLKGAWRPAPRCILRRLKE